MTNLQLATKKKLRPPLLQAQRRPKVFCLKHKPKKMKSSKRLGELILIQKKSHQRQMLLKILAKEEKVVLKNNQMTNLLTKANIVPHHHIS